LLWYDLLENYFNDTEINETNGKRKQKDLMKIGEGSDYFKISLRVAKALQRLDDSLIQLWKSQYKLWQVRPTLASLDPILISYDKWISPKSPNVPTSKICPKINSVYKHQIRFHDFCVKKFFNQHFFILFHFSYCHPFGKISLVLERR
jgi:hypothetical protein